MSENNDQDINTNVSQSDSNESVSEPKSVEPELTKPEPARKAIPAKKSVSGLLVSVAVLLLCAICGFALWYGWQKQQKISEHALTLQSQMEQAQAVLTQLQREQQQQQKIITAAEERESGLTQRLLAAEQRMQAQHKRLQAMSSTSREDWLLAEAEYLLRLANQRVLIEGSPRSADALLMEADEILKNLEDPDLFSLRQAIANDLAQLRLVEDIDQEGLYFSLNALIEQIDKLSLRPSRQEVMTPLVDAKVDAKDEAKDKVEVSDESSIAESDTSAPPLDEKPFWKKIAAVFSETFAFLENYIRFTDHSERPPALLPPDSAVYLQQNLRFKLERAQLALLREEQQIYESSLADAILWLQRYYPKSVGTEAFAKELEQMRAKNIVQQLPDISYSLELLHEYIENLHDLQGVNAQQQKPAANGESL